VLASATWPFEVANALLGRATQAYHSGTSYGLTSAYYGFPISVKPIEVGRAFEQILSVARQQSLTEYDAAYLELALRTGLPLATLDGKVKTGG